MPPPPSPASQPLPAASAFVGAMHKITDAQRDRGVTQEQINGLLRDVGLTVVRDLHTNPDKIPEFEALLATL